MQDKIELIRLKGLWADAEDKNKLDYLFEGQCLLHEKIDSKLGEITLGCVQRMCLCNKVFVTRKQVVIAMAAVLILAVGVAIGAEKISAMGLIKESIDLLK